MTVNVCPTCGTEIPSQAPAGLCPRCLMNGGLESGAVQPFVAATLPSPQPTPAGGFVPPEIADLARRFPQLEILELLGKGGMGAVYKARQRGLDRFVALKILPPEIGNDPAFAERFGREARALGRLSHPNIVGVYDFGQVDGLFYFLMEFVDGANLRQAIRAGGITAKDALSIVGQVCDALQFAHDEGIVHRDIKPENILIDKRGRVKIADFGLAKLLGNEQSEQGLTATHQVMGTLRYMAPEQMSGAKEVDHRADIFSLGVVFYELLTGELPVGRFAVPSKTIGVDVRLDEVVLRALEREPTLRYQQASEVKTQVQAISEISPLVAQHLFGREYRTKAEIFGWPLLHIAYGIDAKTGKRKIARGVIAIGDTAIGGLAIGGGAIGVIACGGLALGIVSFGGLALGLLLAIGGCAIGNFSFGGLAIGTVAVGGCAVGYYAFGGAAFGAYTVTGEHQSPEALQVFENIHFARAWPSWLMWLGLASPAVFGLLYVLIWLVLSLKKDDSESVQRDSAMGPKNPPPPPIPTAPARPWMVVVFAVFNLFFAVALLLMVAASDPEFWKSEYVRGWEAWLMFRSGLSFVHAAGIIIASIGLLLWQPWARQLTVWLCVFALAVLIVELPSIARVDLPYELNSLTNQMKADGIPESDADAVATFLMMVVMGTSFVAGLLMNVAQLLYFTRPNVIAAFHQDELATSQTDTRQQLVNIGRLLIALGIAMLVAWVPLIALGTLIERLPDNTRSYLFWVFPVLGTHAFYSMIAGVVVIRGGLSLTHCEHIGFGKVAIVLCMIPMSIVALVGIPFGLWAWSVLNRRETTLIAEEEVRLRKKAEIAARSGLQDQETIWHDLGVIVGYLLRDQTARFILGLAATLVYLVCLVMFFSFHGERRMVNDIPTVIFEAGQPSPWMAIQANSQGHSWNFSLLTWSNLVALVGIVALQAARKLEELQKGKTHSMIWHYVIWGCLFSMVFGLGMFNLVTGSLERRDTEPKAVTTDSHGGRPLPQKKLEK